MVATLLSRLRLLRRLRLPGLPGLFGLFGLLGLSAQNDAADGPHRYEYQSENNRAQHGRPRNVRIRGAVGQLVDECGHE